MKKIDVHCHTTNRPLKSTANEDASLDAIVRQMNHHEIVRTVVLATYFPHKGTGISNYRLLHWIQHRPEFVLFGSLDFEHFFYQGFNELEEMAEEHTIRGIKLYSAYQKIDFHSASFKKVLNLASRKKLPVMFHGGVSYMLWKKLGNQGVLDLAKSPSSRRQEDYKTPEEIEVVAQQFPEVSFIVSHLCKPFFKEMMGVLKRNKNIFTDASGILDSHLDRAYREQGVNQVRQFFAECGTEQMLFGTDFPVQTHEDSIYFFEESLHGYSETERKRVYFDNANHLIFQGKLSNV